jgi:predicted AAA+ superfamily ATPase
MEQLFEIQRILLEQFEKLPFFSRKIFDHITLDNRISGILGPRGIGKTTFLLHFILVHGAKKRKALYISADNVYFLDHRLLDLVDQLYKETDVRLLCIDEVHKYPNWNQELKNISDTYLDFRIVFSGSSMIDLVQTKYDLSRRVTIYYLHGFSFREHLEWHLKKELPIYTLDEIVKNHVEIEQEVPIPGILKQLQEYYRSGYYPFFWGFTQEREKFQAIENAMQKTIYEDIGTLHSLKTASLIVIEKLFKFIINSLPGELSAYKLAQALGKDFETISTYIHYLQEAGLVRFLYPKTTGKAYLRTPNKIYPDNSNLMYAAYLSVSQDNTLGKVRETFVINHLQNANFHTFHSARGDLCVDTYTFEIGGPSKKVDQIRGEKNGYILADGILTGSKTHIPMYLIGFLY